MSDARLFYAIAHHCNRVQQVRGALASGANAVECDISFDERLLVRHPRDVLEPLPTETALSDYLSALRQLAREHPGWALIIFDLKPSLCAEDVVALLQQVRRELTEPTGLKCIFTAPQFDGRGVLEGVLAELRAGEAAGIDEDDDPTRVVEHFTARGFSSIVFGNGIHPLMPDFFGGPLHASLERALQIKRTTGKIKFVSRWTLNEPRAMQRYLELGVDGIMTDHVPALLAAVREFHPSLKLAGRSDNPF
jgi:glycerophosphoryl diester phosphodiesterase